MQNIGQIYTYCPDLSGLKIRPLTPAATNTDHVRNFNDVLSDRRFSVFCMPVTAGDGKPSQLLSSQCCNEPELKENIQTLTRYYSNISVG